MVTLDPAKAEDYRGLKDHLEQLPVEQRLLPIYPAGSLWPGSQLSGRAGGSTRGLARCVFW